MFPSIADEAGEVELPAFFGQCLASELGLEVSVRVPFPPPRQPLLSYLKLRSHSL